MKLTKFCRKGGNMTEEMIVDAAKDFKDRYKEELKSRNMSQRELSQILGIPEATISLAINTFGVNEQAREVRNTIRKVFNIQDI